MRHVTTGVHKILKQVLQLTQIITTAIQLTLWLLVHNYARGMLLISNTIQAVVFSIEVSEVMALI